MMAKQPLAPERVRTMSGRFACIEPRVVRHGFWSSLSPHARLLSGCLVVVAARNGLSYYGDDTVWTLLRCTRAASLVARNGLIAMDRIAFDGHLLQGLALPQRPGHKPPTVLQSPSPMAQAAPATLRTRIRASLGAHDDGATHHLCDAPPGPRRARNTTPGHHPR